MFKYPLSYVVYIALSFMFGCLLFFNTYSYNLFNVFIVIAFLLLVLSFILSSIKKNISAFILTMLVILLIGHLYSNYRYMNIENKIEYSTEIVAFESKVISYDGEFDYQYGKRERYICEVYNVYDATNMYKTYFRIRLYNASKKDIKINDRLIVNSKINFYKNILTNDNSEYDNELIINALENKMIMGVSSIYRSSQFTIESRFISPLNTLNKYAKKLRAYIKQCISLEDGIEDSSKSIIFSIVLGDKTQLTNRMRELFSNIGLSHILAVSGLHLSIVVLIFNLFLFFLIQNSIYRLSISIILAIITFAPITLFSVSVVRASIMYFLIFLSTLFGKKLNSLNNLFLAALIILMLNPIAILDISFQFSFLATLGIITYYSAYESIYKNKIISLCTNFIILSLSAMIMILPISIYNFHVLNLNSIISNIYGSIYAFIIILLTFIHMILYTLIPSLGLYSIRLLDKIINSFLFIAERQEAVNILKYNTSINIFLALFFTIAFLILGIFIKYRVERRKLG